jgi:hypothetical protein
MARWLASAAVLASATIAAFAMPQAVASAEATEIQRPMERVAMTLPTPRGYNVNVELYPRRDLALLFISKGPRVFGYRRDRHSEVAYAAVDKAEIDGHLIDICAATVTPPC